MPNIFICYRRVDSAKYAEQIYKLLLKKFGEGNVFLDVGIEGGDRFEKVIISTLERSDFFLAIIGKEWLTIKDASGAARISSSSDWVHREIKIALNKHLNIIPILVDGATMPTLSDLPYDLNELREIQAIPLHSKTLATEMKQISGKIDKVRDARETYRQHLSQAINSVIEKERATIRVGVVTLMHGVEKEHFRAFASASSMDMESNARALIAIGCSLVPEGSKKPFFTGLDIKWRIPQSWEEIAEIVEDIIGINCLLAYEPFESYKIEIG